MKVIFLDFDGVIVTRESLTRGNRTYNKTEEQFDEKCITRLNRIVAVTEAHVVITSTWRKIHSLEQMRVWLGRKGFVGRVLGKTPRLPHPLCRGDEIQAWMESQPRMPDKIVIIDDDSDMGRLLDRLVLTNMDGGLLDVHVHDAIDKLEE